MSALNRELHSLFIHVPKCAGTSMENVEWNKGCGHDTLFDFKDKCDFNYTFKWAFVRNPWERLLAFYDDSPESQERTSGSFARFVNELHAVRELLDPDNFSWAHVRGTTLGALENLERIHVYSQFSMLSIDGELRLDFVGRFERLEEDWHAICKELHQQATTLAHHRPPRSFTKPYTDYYTAAMLDKVEEIYQRDAEEFGYSPSPARHFEVVR